MPNNFSTDRRDFRGTVIAIVLVVIVLISLSALSLSKLMLAERRAATYNMRQTQTRYLAESGIDAIRTLLLYNEEDLLEMGGVYDNIDELCGTLVTESPNNYSDDLREVGRFTVVSPLIDENGMPNGVRYGLTDESTKIDLRMILAYEQTQPGVGRAILTRLPGIDESVADAILDWIDEDDDPREYGAEADYYEGLDPPRPTRNGMIESLDELLLVEGVTPSLLYGADWNRNGLIDVGEPDPSQLVDAEGTEYENSDGYLDCGLNAFLTIRSAESQTSSDGSQKVNVNNDDLNTLQQELTSKLNNTEQVNYIIAYRLFGQTALTIPEENESEPSPSSNSQSGSNNASTSENSSGNTPSNAAENAPPTGNSSGASNNSATENASERSFDLSRTPQAKIFSVLDLVGGSLQVQYSGESTTETLNSPFTEASMPTDLPTLLNSLRFNDNEYSRININQASRGVLLAIPGVTEEVADNIIANRVSDPAEQADMETSEETTYNILTTLIDYVDFETLKQIAPYVAVEGTVLTAQFIGRFDASSPATRLHVWLDTSEKPAKIVRVQDLSNLGPGFSPDILGVNQDARSTFSVGNAVNR
ncbi:MAG: general secretion pathway protein GspK [Planctomycetaceae bacterium]|jgi:DNA uptake protein ComE-like DNA-binding protein|nr:general secretion pathway protein GspK [Planctomycetaceae bacterium]